MLCVPTLAPGFLLRSSDSDRSTAIFKETVQGDLRRAVELRRRAPSWDESVILERDSSGRLKNLFPTVQEVWEFCSTARGQLVAADVETTGEHPLSCNLLCVGFAREDGRVLCVPWLKQGALPYWTAGDQSRVWEILRWFFGGGWGGTAAPRFLFHNGSFDSVVLWSMGWGCFDHWRSDSMQALHVLDSELPMGLDYLASRRTEIVYYKDSVKGDHRWTDLDDETLRVYNLRDCICCLRPFPGLMRDLQVAGRNQIDLYQHELELVKEMAKATIRGIFVDQWRKYLLAKKLETDAARNLEILQLIAGSKDFKPGSVDHLRWVLFQRLGLPVVKRTDKDAPSTDKDAMVLLALHAGTKEQQTFLQALIGWRKASKLSSTWVGIWEGSEWQSEEKIVNGKPTLVPVGSQPHGQWIKGIPVLGDGRAHPSWSLRTKTGRFSSSPNVQTFTSAIKKIFCAEPGNELVGLDLSQAELRGIAYYAGDEDLLQMYRRGINIHTANCSLLFQIRCPVAKDTNEATEQYLSEAIPRLLGLRYEDFPLAQTSQWKGQRTLAKVEIFAGNYGGEAETIYELIRAKRDPETDKLLFPNIQLDQVQACKAIWEQTHAAIPRWWKTITTETQKRGFFECPVSGRRRYYKGGFKRNEMLNGPLQTLVGSRMNLGMLRIRDQLGSQYSLPSKFGINLQVHDMLGIECPRGEGARIAEIMDREFDRSFPLPGYPEAVLPTDWKNGEGAKVGIFVDEI